MRRSTRWMKSTKTTAVSTVESDQSLGNQVAWNDNWSAASVKYTLFGCSVPLWRKRCRKRDCRSADRRMIAAQCMTPCPCMEPRHHNSSSMFLRHGQHTAGTLHRRGGWRLHRLLVQCRCSHKTRGAHLRVAPAQVEDQHQGRCQPWRLRQWAMEMTSALDGLTPGQSIGWRQQNVSVMRFRTCGDRSVGAALTCGEMAVEPLQKAMALVAIR